MRGLVSSLLKSRSGRWGHPRGVPDRPDTPKTPLPSDSRHSQTPLPSDSRHFRNAPSPPTKTTDVERPYPSVAPPSSTGGSRAP